MRFYTAAAERMRIDSSGNVGIGTIGPDSRLHIAEDNSNAITATSTNVNRIIFDDTSGSSATNAGFALDFEGVFGGLGRIAIVKQNGATSGASRDFGRFKLFLNSNTSESNYAAFQECLNIDPGDGLKYSYRGDEQLRITSSGNLDIGGAGSGGYVSGALIQSGGKIASYVSNSTTGSEQRIYVYNGSTTSYPASISADGSATFAGSVSIGGTAAANTIDEYEEGTWTPTVIIGNSSAGITYKNNTGGSYTRIGRLVFIHVRMDIDSKGSNTGNVKIGNLPYPAANIQSGNSSIECSFAISGYSSNGIRNSSLTNATLGGTVSENQTKVSLAFHNLNDGSSISVNNNSIVNGSSFSFDFSYQIA